VYANDGNGEPGTEIAAYAYDGQNHRTTKTVAGTTTHYYYDAQWQVLEERRGESTQPSAQYLWSARGRDMPAARWADLNDDGDFGDANEVAYYCTDADGNVTSLVNTSGQVIERYAYDPYGGGLMVMKADWTAQDSVGGADPGTRSAFANEILWEGYRQNPETGNYQVRHREYSPTRGRFLQRDSIGYAWTMNLYAYASANPLTGSDPLGLCAPTDGSAANAARGITLTEEEHKKLGIPSDASWWRIVPGTDSTTWNIQYIDSEGFHNVPVTKDHPLWNAVQSFAAEHQAQMVSMTPIPSPEPPAPPTPQPAAPTPRTPPAVQSVLDRFAVWLTLNLTMQYDTRSKREQALGKVTNSVGVAGKGFGAAVRLTEGNTTEAFEYGKGATLELITCGLGGVGAAYARGATTVASESSTLTQTYRLGANASRSEILQVNRSLYDEFVSGGGRLISQRDLNMVKNGRQVLGEYNLVENTITVYRGSNLSTVSEELIHSSQVQGAGLVGQPIPRTMSLMFERDAAVKLQQMGYVPR